VFLRNGQKRNKKSKKKTDREKVVSHFFGQKGFDMDFPKKGFCGVCEYKNAIIKVKILIKKKKAPTYPI
jgi:hypothetical protein